MPEKKVKRKVKRKYTKKVKPQNIKPQEERTGLALKPIAEPMSEPLCYKV